MQPTFINLEVRLCNECSARAYAVTCPYGAGHYLIQHNEGACSRWYDVGAVFEDGFCSLCPQPDLGPLLHLAAVTPEIDTPF